jgi:type I restriction-modification system DNA methylase subunit
VAEPGKTPARPTACRDANGKDAALPPDTPAASVACVKLFRETLFNRKTIAAALQHHAPPTADQLEAAQSWGALAADQFGGRNESQLEQAFNATLLQRILGYRDPAPGQPGTMLPKQPIGPRIVDVALGQFATEARIIAPVELKGPKTDLDRIMPGRAKTPVQQAWEYAMDAPGARWVIVSNMKALRLYAFGHGTSAYEDFDLADIATPETLARFTLLLSAANLLGTATAELLARSAGEDRDITTQLYRDYRDLRLTLIQFVADQHPEIPPEPRITLVQKLLDRLIFIAYAEDTVLLPEDRLKLAVTHEDPFQPRPKWDNVKALFAAVDTGNPRLGITGYNGGLFAPDALLESLALPDHLVATFLKLAAYDYRSEISVTILGHLFEQTISDIEADLLVARGLEPPAASKKKKHGIVYTPDFVTRFIVEQTVGRLVHAIRAELLGIHAAGESDTGDIVWTGPEADFWRAFLARLAAITILDPACGSGHFLVAAYDLLAAVTKEANDRLRELDPLSAEDSGVANARIITRNLYGVDLNAESVEITRLSLWLKTAQPRQPLTALDHNIRVGNSIIEDADFHTRAFVWRTAFPEITTSGGFDIVVGNPPYVRMEHLKPIKPYLETRYAVVSDRADLYAYFFELGVRLLKPGGRLGYISSSTFFRTKSGAPLRDWLGKAADLDTVIDFGDAQLFEGVTTYPTILVMTKRADAATDPTTEPVGDLRFLNLKAVPDDLGKAFEEGAQAMPRSRLARTGWRFEGDRLAELRARMAAGRPTLKQVYGAPLRGIVTGLNEAFVLPRNRRDELVAADPRSADLLKPFLIGENLKRWHVESDDLWLIYTPKNRVMIDDYPAVRDHLLPFRAALEKRATKQNWWELQQAQAAYEGAFAAPKLIWPHFQNEPSNALDHGGYYLNNKAFFIANPQPSLSAVLNSTPLWCLLKHIARAKRGGYLEAEAQYVETLPDLDTGTEGNALAETASVASSSAAALLALRIAVHARLADINPAIPTIAAFENWPALDFPTLRALIQKRCKADIPVNERDAWDRYLTEKRAEAATLASRIADAEAEINDRTYRLFDLSSDDIALIEDSIAGQY